VIKTLSLKFQGFMFNRLSKHGKSYSKNKIKIKFDEKNKYLWLKNLFKKYIIKNEFFYKCRKNKLNIIGLLVRTKSDTSGKVEYTKVIERIISKELGKMTP